MQRPPPRALAIGPPEAPSIAWSHSYAPQLDCVRAGSDLGHSRSRLRRSLPVAKRRVGPRATHWQKIAMQGAAVWLWLPVASGAGQPADLKTIAATRKAAVWRQQALAPERPLSDSKA